MCSRFDYTSKLQRVEDPDQEKPSAVLAVCYWQRGRRRSLDGTAQLSTAPTHMPAVRILVSSAFRGMQKG